MRSAARRPPRGTRQGRVHHVALLPGELLPLRQRYNTLAEALGRVLVVLPRSSRPVSKENGRGCRGLVREDRATYPHHHAIG